MLLGFAHGLVAEFGLPCYLLLLVWWVGCFSGRLASFGFYVWVLVLVAFGGACGFLAVLFWFGFTVVIIWCFWLGILGFRRVWRAVRFWRCDLVVCGSVLFAWFGRLCGCVGFYCCRLGCACWVWVLSCFALILGCLIDCGSFVNVAWVLLVAVVFVLGWVMV